MKHMAILCVVVGLYCGFKFGEYKIGYFQMPDTAIRVTIAEETTMAASKWYRIIHGNILYAVYVTGLPQIAMVYHDVKIILQLRTSCNNSSQSEARTDHVTRLVVFIITTSLVCQVPALINQILWNTLPAMARDCGGLQFYLSPASNALIVINSASSFPIHIFFNPRFRDILMPSLRRHRVSNRTILDMEMHNLTDLTDIQSSQSN
jgi:hypothetical protein